MEQYKDLIERTSWQIVDIITAYYHMRAPVDTYGVNPTAQKVQSIYNEGDQKMDEEFAILAYEVFQEAL